MVTRMKEGVLEQRGCSFQVDKFQHLSTIQGLCQMWACLINFSVRIPDYQRVRISGGPHLGVPLYLDEGSNLLFLLLS